MRTATGRILLLLTATLLVTGCQGDRETGGTSAEAPSHLAAAVAIGTDGQMHPGETDRCPVCAMTTHDRKMGAAIELSDDRTFYFCGPGCMMKSWLHPEIFLGAKDVTVKRAIVTDFFTGEHVDATAVNWVAGSDVLGPMGPMIVPVVGKEALATFLERHGGKTTFSLAELDDAMWETLTGKKAMPHDSK